MNDNKPSLIIFTIVENPPRAAQRTSGAATASGKTLTKLHLPLDEKKTQPSQGEAFALLRKCLEHALPVQHSQPGEIPDFSDLKAILNFQCIYSFQATQIPTAASDNEIDTVIMSLQSGRLRQSKSRSLD